MAAAALDDYFSSSCARRQLALDKESAFEFMSKISDGALVMVSKDI